MSLLTRRLLFAASEVTPLPDPDTSAFTDHLLTQNRVALSSGVTFTVNAPTKDASNPLFPTSPESDGWDHDKTFLTVHPDGAGGFRMHYVGYESDGAGPYACYATSADGVTWSKPNLGQVTFDGSTDNNIIVSGSGFGFRFYDEATARWVTASQPAGGTELAIWTTDDPTDVPAKIKTISVAESYVEAKAIVRRPDGRWVLYYNHGHSSSLRTLAAYVSDTTDLTGTWTAQGDILTPGSSTDQFYSFGPQRIGGTMYGLAMMYDSTTEQTWVDLYEGEPDGLNWTLAKAEFIPVGAAGSWDDEMIILGHRLNEDGDDWHAYYCGAPVGHATSPRDARIGRARVARERVAEVGTTGDLVTVGIDVASGATLTVNADAAGGALDMEVQDASGTPLTGFAQADFDTITTDARDHVPTWGGVPMPDDQTLKLKFVLSSATLYGYEISDAEEDSFDPISDISWHTVFWAEDPNWTDPGDGNAVSQWDDASGNGRHATQATGAKQPLYRSSVVGLNSKPAVEFDGTDDWLATAPFAAAITGPSEHFLIARMAATGSMAFLHGISTSARRSIQEYVGGWGIFQGGTPRNGGSIDTSAHAFRAVFDSTDTLDVDGTATASGDAGTENLTGLRLGANAGGSASFLDGHIAFVGVVEGTLTATERADLLAWAQQHYGTP